MRFKLISAAVLLLAVPACKHLEKDLNNFCDEIPPAQILLTQPPFRKSAFHLFPPSAPPYPYPVPLYPPPPPLPTPVPAIAPPLGDH